MEDTKRGSSGKSGVVTLSGNIPIVHKKAKGPDA